jgi:hypothetical protein
LGEVGTGQVLNPNLANEFRKIVSMARGYPHLGELVIQSQHCSVNFESAKTSFRCEYNDHQLPLKINFLDLNSGGPGITTATQLVISADSSKVSVRITNAQGQAATYNYHPSGVSVESVFCEFCPDIV